MKVTYLKIAGILLFAFIKCTAFADDISILAYGAKSDKLTMNTKAIQKAIDVCSKTGGRVIVPTGTFNTGTLYLKSNVTLYLEKGALLLGSINFNDYPANTPVSLKCGDTHDSKGKPKHNKALIYAESQENIAIEGNGTIDGNGGNPVFSKGDNGDDRPKIIFFISCNNVIIKDVLLKNAAFWVQDYLGCDGVKIQGIRVLSHSNWNNDGIDIDSKNVVVSDCIIDSDDDAVCLKSYLADQPVENVTITNCIISTNCNAIKFGTPGRGGFKDIAISNCAVNASRYSNFREWPKHFDNITTDPSMVSGISLECVDGGKLDNVTLNNINMKGTQTPIFIKLGNRQKLSLEDAGSLRNVIISNIIAEVHSGLSSSITGYPGNYIENVKLHHILFDVISTSTLEKADKEVKENETGYPTPRMLGRVLPANGFYIRHVKNISVEDVQINLIHKDNRYPIVFDDTHFGDLKGISLKDESGKTNFIDTSQVKVLNSSQISLEGSKLD